jgi:hypothetical protein
MRSSTLSVAFFFLLLLNSYSSVEIVELDECHDPESPVDVVRAAFLKNAGSSFSPSSTSGQKLTLRILTVRNFND